MLTILRKCWRYFSLRELGSKKDAIVLLSAGKEGEGSLL
jgi:hypothetical protein